MAEQPENGETIGVDIDAERERVRAYYRAERARIAQVPAEVRDAELHLVREVAAGPPPHRRVSEPTGAQSTVALVLDTSAVLAYADGSMHVHEPVLLAAEVGEDVAVPVLCLIEAVRRNPGIDLQDLLHAEAVLTVMPDRHTDADLLADWTIYLGGREDAAAAAVITYRHEAALLTGEPDLYTIAGHRPDWIISINGKW